MQNRRSCSMETLPANDVVTALWSKSAAEKCRLGLTDTVFLPLLLSLILAFLLGNLRKSCASPMVHHWKKWRNFKEKNR
jgi:hypothetical protein